MKISSKKFTKPSNFVSNVKNKERFKNPVELMMISLILILIHSKRLKFD